MEHRRDGGHLGRLRHRRPGGDQRPRRLGASVPGAVRRGADHFDGTGSTETPAAPAAGRFPMDLDATPGGDLWVVGSLLGGGRHASLAERLCPSRPANTGFAPTRSTVPFGSALAWHVPAGDPHITGSSTRPAWACSTPGTLAETETFTQRFGAAATYPVDETTNGTSQTVRVRPSAAPRPRLGPGTVKVAWAAGEASTGARGRRPDPAPRRIVDLAAPRHPPRLRTVSSCLRRRAGSTFRARLRSTDPDIATPWSPPTNVVPV